MNSVSYKFYPSALDKFQSLLNSDRLWEEFYGQSEEPSISPEEYTAKMEKELIDGINRVPFVSEAASCGTAFNEIVDCIIMRKPTEREGLVITTHEDGSSIDAALDGFSFRFSPELCSKMADYFSDCIPQYRCSAILPTKYGNVELYGNIDYLGYNKVFDLKTTKNYSAFGKFEDHWQRYTYPYCLVASGDCTEICEFEFSICKLKSKERGSDIVDADFYRECFTYDHQQATGMLTAICERFIEWLNLHKAQITDKKIFGGEKE